MHPGARPLSLVILLFLLIPSAAYLWHYSDLPQFGDLHDDSIYYVSAKSLADGGGYRIESLPGEPSQTKYPPLYPLLLSAAWRLDPQFPHNVPIAAWLSWLALPAMLLQLMWLYPRMGISGWRAWLLLALLAVNPYVILFSASLLSELLFTVLMISTMLLTERASEKVSRPAVAIAAGAVAGLCYLTRSAAIVFLLAAPVYLWIRREPRKALIFAGAMFPFIAGWMIWVRAHQVSTTDPSLIYYLDYFRYELYSVSLRDLPVFLWKNLDGLLWGLGGLILPKIIDSTLLKMLSEVLAVAMISGVVRLVRRGDALLYTLFAAGSAILLVIWHFPPNERFVLPLFPLALAGLLVEMEHLSSMLRAGLDHKDRGQRVVAGALIAVVVGIFAGALALQLYVSQTFLPEDAHQHRLQNLDRIDAYGWIRAKLPADASVMAANDGLLYLYTGRHSMRRSLPPALWYREDHPAIIQWMSDIKPFARDHGLAYFDFAGVEVAQGIDDKDTAAIEKAIQSSPDLNLLYRKNKVTVFGFR
jgi:hypothetical protein